MDHDDGDIRGYGMPCRELVRVIHVYPRSRAARVRMRTSPQLVRHGPDFIGEVGLLVGVDAHQTRKTKVTIRAEVLRLWTATSIRGSENSTYMIFHERLRYLLNPVLMLMDDPLKG
jgi:hypothetical protein